MKTLTFTFTGDDKVIDSLLDGFVRHEGWTEDARETQSQYAHKLIHAFMVEKASQELENILVGQFQSVTAG